MIDIESIVAQRLISLNIASGNVIVLNQAVEYNPPAVMIQLTQITGTVNEGFYDCNIYATCITNDEYDTLYLADLTRKALDGYGDANILNIEHVSSVPQRNSSIEPITHSVVLNFRVLYQDLI